MTKAVALLVVLALAGLLFTQWHDWPRPLEPAGTPTAATPSDPVTASPPPVPGPPEAKETYAAVAEHTLFRPQRKPEPPAPAEPAPEQAASEDGTLDGIDLSAVLIAPGVATAWVKEPNAAQLKRLRLGDDQTGWSVRAILPDRVTLERQGETKDLLLQDFSQPAAPPPAAPPPARPNAAGRPGQPPAPNPTAARQPPTAGAPQRPPGQVGGPRPPTPPQSRANARRPIPPRPQ